MGGEGSGRKPSEETMVKRMYAPVNNLIGDGTEAGNFVMPNLSGVQKAARNQSGLTNGGVLFSNSNGQITQDNSNFFWDDTNNRLGIGTTSPAFKLDVAGAGTQVIQVHDTTNTIKTRLTVDSSGYGYVGTATNHPFHIIANDAIKATVLANGNVGIGTSSPAELLHIGGGAGATPTIRLGNTGAGIGAEIERDISGGQLNFDVQTANTAVNYYQFKNDGTAKVVIDGTGDVGIGTTTPSEKLHVSGGNVLVNVGHLIIDDGRFLEWGTGQTGITGRDDQDYISFYTSNTDQMRLDGSGNLGIGDVSPNQKLHVYTTAGTQSRFERNGGSAGTTGKTDIIHSNFGYAGGTGADTIIASDWGIGFQVNVQGTPSYPMLITNGGLVGIGDTTPSKKLTILTATENDGLLIRESDDGNDAARLYAANGGGQLQLVQGGTVTVNFDATGSGTNNYVNTGANFGIGTTNPASTLDVSGSINVSGSAPVYKISGSSGATGTFTTADLKTVTVYGGIITSIV